jgi:hypothetical protein
VQEQCDECECRQVNRSSATVKSRARREQCDECQQQTESGRTYHAKEAKDGSDEEEGGEEFRQHHGWLFLGWKTMR